jgi:hypothetical protein
LRRDRECRPGNGDDGKHDDEDIGRIYLPEQRFRSHAQSLKTVADAAHRLDVFAIIAQLFAQADDLHVHCPVRDRVVVTAHRIDNLVAGKDPARPAGQKMQDPKFGKGQLYRLPVDHHLVATGVNHQPVNMNDRGFVGPRRMLLTASKYGADTGDENPGLKGLVT